MKKGISLITLIITIVVIIILAAAVILTLGSNNPINSSKIASLVESKGSMDSSISLMISKLMADTAGESTTEQVVKERVAIDDTTGIQVVKNGMNYEIYQISAEKFKNVLVMDIENTPSKNSSWYVSTKGKVFLVYESIEKVPNFLKNTDNTLNEAVEHFIILLQKSEDDFENNESASEVNYTVIHQKMDLDGTTYIVEETENFKAKVGSEITPSVKTYVGFTSPIEQKVIVSSDGTTTVTYNYTRNKYQFNLEKDQGIDTLGSTVSGNYYYGETITLKALVTLDGFRWCRWESSDVVLIENIENASASFEMPAGDVSMFPIAELSTYKINYNLNGGTLYSQNPSTYEKDGDEIVLNNPVKNGYGFLGWTGSNGTTPQKIVTIESGSVGEKNYTANWKVLEPINYSGTRSPNASVSYTFTPTSAESAETCRNQANVNEVKCASFNIPAAGYTIVINVNADSGCSIIIKNSSNTNVCTATHRIKYTFTSSGIYYIYARASASVCASGSVSGFVERISDEDGNVVFGDPAYNINYDLDGGSVSKANPTTYETSGSNIELINPKKAGYEFVGWTGSNGSTPQIKVSIPSGSIGDKTFKVNWKTPDTFKFSGVGKWNLSITSSYTPNSAETAENCNKYSNKDSVKIAEIYIPKEGYKLECFSDNSTKVQNGYLQITDNKGYGTGSYQKVGAFITFNAIGTYTINAVLDGSVCGSYTYYGSIVRVVDENGNVVWEQTI